MIDLSSETPITLSQVVRHRLVRPLSRNGRPVSPSTPWRWSKKGVKGVKLETVQIGGTYCTTERALIRFIERLSGAAMHDDRGDTPAVGYDSRRAHEQAERELAAAGV